MFPLSVQFDLDSIWSFIFGVPASSATVVSAIHNVCTEAAFLLLAMLRSMLNLVRPFINILYCITLRLTSIYFLLLWRIFIRKSL